MAKKKNNLSKGALSQTSLEYLGLSKQPFAAEILSEKTFFRSQALEKIEENLTHQIQFSELILIVEGLQGSGKTSLFRDFIQQDIANTKTLSVQAEATDTLIQIQHKMSLHLEDLGDANHLDDNLKSLQTFDQIPVLVMDNSHVLSDTTLQELFRYQHELSEEQSVTLKILLFSNSGMSSTLEKITDIQAEQMYVQTMPEYSPKQVDNFLFHKLRHAGYAGEPLFDEKSLQLLYKKSPPSLQGYMNTAAPLIDRIVERKLKPGMSLWLKLIIALLVITLLAAAGAAYFFYSSKETLTTELPTSTETATSPAPLFADEATQDLTAETDPVTDTPVTDNTVLDENTASETLQDTAAPIAPEMPELVTNDKTDSTAETVEAVVTGNEEQKPVEPIPSAPAPVEKIKSAVQPVATEAIEVTPAETQQNLAAVVAAPPKAPATKPSVIKHPALQQLDRMGISDVSWIRQQPASSYTLQLIGARDPETLLKFARRHQLGKDSAWYKTWLKAKPYYVLIHGSYSNRDVARNAVSALNPALRSVKPWVKSMAAVKQSIK